MLSRPHHLFLKSRWLISLLILSAYLNPTRADETEEESFPLSSWQIRELLRAKMQLDPAIPDATKETLHCETIIDSIVNTTETFPISKAPVSRVVQHENFKVICTTPARIKSMIGSTSASAFFTIAPVPAINFASPLEKYNAHHEFLHADNFFRHRTTACPSEGLKAALPVYPPSKEKMTEYKKALEAGDRRIEEFERLWIKKKKKEVLNQKEQQTLKRYMEASKDCLLPVIKDINPLSTWDALKKQGIKPGSVMTRDHVSMRLLSIKKTTQHTVILLEPIDPAVGVFQILKDVKNKLHGNGRDSDSYQKLSEEEYLLERDAYVRQRLSHQAIAVFYPEAEKLYQADIVQCAVRRTCS